MSGYQTSRTFLLDGSVHSRTTATLGTLRGRGPSLAMGGAAKRRLGGLKYASHYIGEFFFGVGQADIEGLFAGGWRIVHGIIKNLLANRA